jgi:hypothetical protein
MRKFLVITLIGTLLFAALPGAAIAGERHSGNQVAAGIAIGATAAVIGGVLLSAFSAPAVAPPVVYAPPPVVYAPAPRVVYTPAPPIVYGAPPIIYRPAPVVVHRHWAPRGHWGHRHYQRGGGWHHR